MTPTPPEGFKIIPREWLEAGNPLPEDAMFSTNTGAWIESYYRYSRVPHEANKDGIDFYATAQPLPCFQKGGDEPCRTILDSATPVSDTDGLAGERPVPSVPSNAPVAVQSPDQGPGVEMKKQRDKFIAKEEIRTYERDEWKKLHDDIAAQLAASEKDRPQWLDVLRITAAEIECYCCSDGVATRQPCAGCLARAAVKINDAAMKGAK